MGKGKKKKGGSGGSGGQEDRSSQQPGQDVPQLGVPQPPVLQAQPMRDQAQQPAAQLPPAGRGGGRGRGRGNTATVGLPAVGGAAAPPLPPTVTADAFPVLGGGPPQPSRARGPVEQQQSGQGAQPQPVPGGPRPQQPGQVGFPRQQTPAQPQPVPGGPRPQQPGQVGTPRQQTPAQPQPVPGGPRPQQPGQVGTPRQQTPAQPQPVPGGPRPQQPGQVGTPRQQTPAQPMPGGASRQHVGSGNPAKLPVAPAPSATPIQSSTSQAPLDMKAMQYSLPAAKGGELKPIPRPDKGGTKGRKIPLRANFFPIKFTKEVDIEHYDIDVASLTSKAKIRLAVMSFLNHNPSIVNGILTAFDGRKNLFTHKPLNLPAGQSSFSVSLEGDGPNARPVTLKIQHVNRIAVSDLNDFLNGRTRDCPLLTIQALDIVMREMPNRKYVPIANYFFTDPAGKGMGVGLELWNGYYQSIRPTAWKCVMLQMDASVRVFHKGQDMLDLLSEYINYPRERFTANLSFKDEYEKNGFQSHIKGLAVDDVHQEGTKRTYRIIGLSKLPAEQQKFPLTPHGDAQPQLPAQPAKMMTVTDYFKSQYGITLKYPKLHCLQAQPADKHRYIPMEFCVVKKGQQLKRLNEELTAELIKYSAKPAFVRAQQINEVVNKINYNDEYAKAFGMSIAQKMIEFNGRVLMAPDIEYDTSKKIRVRDGSWNMRDDVKFYKAATAKKMAAISFDNFRNDGNNVIGRFINDLSAQANKMGMRLPPLSLLEYGRNDQDVLPLMKKLKNALGVELELIIVVLPFRSGKDVYGEVKKVGDTVLGIVTQCVLPKNVSPTKPQTLANICLKINAKLGSVNSIIDNVIFSPIMKRPVMIMGADVTHPAPGEDAKPSIAAVTASYDSKASMYACRISIQNHREEIIADLANITKELLINFRARTNRKPEKIIFYRDGVSEGQFKTVLADELRAIQMGCHLVEPGYQPGITFIVVQKRHHTRLFPVNKQDESGRAGNVPAGTTVDTDIVHPFEFDFYLCSHQGIQGTSKPAHYYVLYDDSNFSSDILQEFTYQLCHLYVRCTRSVSIPPPAYYAHHCAFRGRYYLDRYPAYSALPSNDAEGKRMLEAMNKGCMVHENIKGMYFA